MSAAAQIVEAFGIQPGTVLAAEITKQLSAAEALALRETKLTGDLAERTKLLLVSRGGNARATFVAPGRTLSVFGTCNKDGSYVCIGEQEPPTPDLDGPFEFVVEGHCISVYQLKQLVWQCGCVE